MCVGTGREAKDVGIGTRCDDAWRGGWDHCVEVRLREMRFDDDDDGLVLAVLYAHSSGAVLFN